MLDARRHTALTHSLALAAFFLIPAEQFKLVIDSITWAMKHTMRNVNETGLSVLHELLINVSQSTAAQEFYKTFFLSLMEHVFAVLSDPAHQSGMRYLSSPSRPHSPANRVSRPPTRACAWRLPLSALPLLCRNGQLPAFDGKMSCAAVIVGADTVSPAMPLQGSSKYARSWH